MIITCKAQIDIDPKYVKYRHEDNLRTKDETKDIDRNQYLELPKNEREQWYLLDIHLAVKNHAVLIDPFDDIEFDDFDPEDDDFDSEDDDFDSEDDDFDSED